MFFRVVREQSVLSLLFILSLQIFIFSPLCKAQSVIEGRVLTTTTLRAVYVKPDDLASSLLGLDPVVSVVQTSNRGCELVMHGTPPVRYSGRLSVGDDGNFTCRFTIADSLFCKISNRYQGDGATCLYCVGDGNPRVDFQYCGVSANEWPGELQRRSRTRAKKQNFFKEEL